MTVPVELLEEWSAALRAADLWRAASGEPVDPARLAAAYLKVLAWAPKREDAYQSLLEQGSFGLAERFPVPPQKTEKWAYDLWAAHARTTADVEQQITDLQRRSERVRRPDLFPVGMVPLIRGWRGEEATTAQQALREIEQGIEAAEEAYSTLLRQRLAEAAARADAAGDDPLAWILSVERAVTSKDYDLADELLADGPHDGLPGDHVAVPNQPLPWTYDKHPPGVILQWLVAGEGARREFYAQWAPPESDERGWKLISALRAFVDGTQLNAGTVDLVVDALERFLGEEPSGVRFVEALEKGFRTRLRGLVDPGAPYLASRAHSNGIPLYLEGAGEWADLDDATDDEPVVLFTLRPKEATPRNVIWLSPAHLFRALRDIPNRRLNVLRAIMPQVPPERAFSTETPDLSPPAVWDREVEIRRLLESGTSSVQLVFGCPGVGTSAVLRKAAYFLEQQGWERIDLSDLSASSWPEALQAQDSERVVITYDAPTLQGIQLLRTLMVHESGSRRVVRAMLAGRFEARDLLAREFPDAEVWQIEPLSFRAVRAFGERILDVHGISFNDQALDRIAYYSAGRPALAYALLRTLFVNRAKGGLPPGATLGRNHVEQAVHDPLFSARVRPWILAPIERSRKLRMAYAGVIAALSLDGSIVDRFPRWSSAQIRDFLREEDLSLADSDFEIAMNRLADLEIIEPLNGPDSPVVLATGAVSSMCVAMSGSDPCDYLLKTKQIAGLD